MTTYADSSALVTLYAIEPGRDELSSEAALVAGQLARVEVPAALWRKNRVGELEPHTARILTDTFESDFFGTDEEAPRFVVVAVTASILEDAARLCAAHGLRAYDAVQLASALAARSADPTCDRFAAYDDGLRRAAAAEGFTLIPQRT